MSERKEIICMGEILWDALPSGLFMGGAPLNVCIHLCKMGEKATIASRIGEDRLGNELMRRLRALDMDTSLIQRDQNRETGFVEVEIDIPDDPGYSIIQPVAWDYMQSTGKLIERARDAWGLLYGSLGQRSVEARESTRELMEMEGPSKIFDMNLRYPHYDREIVGHSIRSADILKVNEKELAVLQDWYELSRNVEEALDQLSVRFDLGVICLSRGGQGSALYRDGQVTGHAGYEVEVLDSVGAGDAFLAGAIHGIKQEWEADDILSFANAAGAFVATRSGGTPFYTIEQIERIMEDGRGRIIKN